MSNDVVKKESEIRILKMIFGDKVNFRESEQPDFILEYGKGIEYGVEITELFYNGTSARLKNDKYINDLLVENKYWHKEDRKKELIKDITYYAQDNGYSPVEMQAVFIPQHSHRDYYDSLLQAIKEKNSKLCKYDPSIRGNCILIIYDRETPFKKTDTFPIIPANLSDTIRRSEYEEIFIVTNINGKDIYLSLKREIFNSDFSQLIEFMKTKGLTDELIKRELSPLAVFGEVLIRRGFDVKFGKVDVKDVDLDGNLVLYCGRYGIGIQFYSDDWGIASFDTFPLKNIQHPIGFALDPQTDILNDQLFQEYETLLKRTPIRFVRGLPVAAK